MCRVISGKGKFKILQTSKDYVVVNTEGVYKQHSHHQNRRSAEKLIILLQKGLMPKSEYLKVSAKRLLGEEDFNKLRGKRKKKYVNRRQ